MKTLSNSTKLENSKTTFSFFNLFISNNQLHYYYDRIIENVNGQFGSIMQIMQIFTLKAKIIC